MRTRTFSLLGLSIAILFAGCRDGRTQTVTSKATTTPTVSRAIDLARLADADIAIEQAIALGDIPGAVLVVGSRDGILYRKAYGAKSVLPQREPMTPDTVFDLASLTKPLATATSVMILAERGKIDLNAKAGDYLPDFSINGKEAVTVRQLMTHVAGLTPDNDLADYAGGAEAAYAKINSIKPISPPGSKFAYSDVGYIALVELVKKVDGRSLDAFAREEIYAPLAMADAGYLPPAALKGRGAPTEQRNGHWMIGEVHDPRAYALGGVAGHAGLFATADDVARFCRMILNEGELDGKRILSAQSIAEMTRPIALPAGGSRSLGFDIDTGYSVAPRGGRFPRGRSFGHTGFTGTMFWIDPADDIFVVLLTNAVHPNGKGKTRDLRYNVSTAVAEAAIGAVLPGLDNLKRDHFEALKGRRVALITNHTGVDRNGNRTIDLLAKAPGVTLVRIFSPEHGIAGKVDEKVGNATDEKTGLPIASLYGDTRRPRAAMLEGIDTIVFDIQDIGARFYTYISTMGLCMEEAAKRKIRFVVLDRPNPNTGLLVDGPIAEKKYFGFIAYGPIPVAHGMTVGELAKMFNAEFKIGCDLQVIEMEHWSRRLWWDETGLRWINPSPNIQSPTQATLYLALGLLETTNISVGRGTDEPFEVLGAPWIDGPLLANSLNARNLPGITFSPAEFTPKLREFAGQKCSGIRVSLIDRNAFKPSLTAATISTELDRLFGEKFHFADVGKMFQNDKAMAALRSRSGSADVTQTWEADLQQFRTLREKYLIYK